MSIAPASGSPTIGRPELTKAIQNIAAKAKKQLEETGSLAGFEADYKDVTGDGTITLSVSALAMSFYDKSAKPEDSLLAYKLDAANNAGDNVSGGTGSSLTIGDAEDVDAFAQRLVDTTYDLTIWQNDGSPEDLVATRGDASAQAAASTAGTGSAPTLDSRLTAFQRQQEATDRLVGALQDFLDGLRKSAMQRSRPDPMDPTQSKQGALKNLLIRLDVTA